MKTVTFLGHSKILSEELREAKRKMYNILKPLINEGASDFFLGGYGDFDYASAEVVNELKRIYPHIKSVNVIPYIDKSFDKELYDESLFPPIENVPKKFAISKRNEWMIDNADVVVAYVKYSFGGAKTSLNYAKRKKKQIINICEI